MRLPCLLSDRAPTVKLDSVRRSSCEAQCKTSAICAGERLIVCLDSVDGCSDTDCVVRVLISVLADPGPCADIAAQTASAVHARIVRVS